MDLLSKFAKKCGYTESSLNLSLATIEDIDVPDVVKQKVYPNWAINMVKNKNDKHLLVLYGADGADEDVLKALIPILYDDKVCTHEIKHLVCCLVCSDSNKLKLPKPVKDRLAITIDN